MDEAADDICPQWSARVLCGQGEGRRGQEFQSRAHEELIKAENLSSDQDFILRQLQV